MLVISILKPIAVFWLGLKFLDDVSLMMRITRLAAVLIPGNSDNQMCDLCDDVMGDLLVQDGVSNIPCKLLCLRLPACVKMCESVKHVSETSTKYPCVAAGYCDAAEEHFADSDLECKVGRFFSCTPSKYCHRARHNLNWSCKLRPGIGRWVGLTNSISSHAGAVAAALLEQPHCSEPNAGPYCIAKPKGFGAACEMLGMTLSIVYGGYRSIRAIESPGGDDDTQWLTFWLILVVVMSIERFFARPILSTLSMYYEFKLLVTIWLLWFNGAEASYRKIRRFLVLRKQIEPETHANKELALFEEAGKVLIRQRLQEIKSEILKEKRSSIRFGSMKDAGAINPIRRSSVPGIPDWEPDDVNDDQVHPAEEFHKLCDYLLSKEGALDLVKSEEISSLEKAKLLEAASYHVQFQPKYLYVRLVGTVEGPEGELPAMDSNGLADPYVTCRIVPNGYVKKEKEKDAPPKPKTSPLEFLAQKRTNTLELLAQVATSRTMYNTTTPQWNELLELRLSAGFIDENGMYRNDTVQNTSLHLEVWDTDVEFWGIVLRFSPFIVVTLGVATIAGYVTGLSDHLTERQLVMIRTVYVVVGAVLVVSYVMAVIRKADDEAIGQCTVPLHILMDKGEHSLRLTLRDIDSEALLSDSIDEDESTRTDNPRLANSVGGLGVLRVRLMLSET
jgi:hypothetical protein